MNLINENIYIAFDIVEERKNKEEFLNQNSRVIWVTGLSGSGKSTIALGVDKALRELGYLTQVLDGDNIRSGINSNLGFSEEDRAENIRRIAEVSKLFINCGVITINCFISPTIEMRQRAKTIIGEGDFIEVYVNTPFEVCEERDVRGLYKKAKEGKVKNFTGIDQVYEAPENPDIEIDTTKLSIDEAVKKVIDYVLPQIKMKE